MSIPFCEQDSFVSLLFDEHPEPMWVIDPASGRITAVNDAAIRKYGYTREQFLAKRIPDLHPAGERADFEGAFEGAFEQVPLRAFTTRHLTASGMILDVEITSRRCPIGGHDAILAMAQDVTTARTTARAWHEAQARLEHILTTTPAVTYVLTIDGDRVVPCWVSDNITERLGYTPADALHPDWWANNVHPDDVSAVAMTQFGNWSKAEHAREFRFRCATGGWRWIHDEQRVVYTSDGTPREIVGSWLDVTEQRRLKHELWQNQKTDALGRFASGIAHDFNNILTVIRSYADFGIESIERTDMRAAQDELAEIVKAVERAGALTRQLLTFSRREAAAPRELSLNSVMTEVTDMLRRVIGEDVELIVTPHEPLSLIRADRGQLEQVMMNLAANARDAMPHGGQLFIRTAAVDVPDAPVDGYGSQCADDGVPAGNYVLLSVTDTGMGMDAKTRERMFEPFFTTKARGRGTGLGLATVHSIIRQTGGHICVQSTVNGGTTFRLYFPAATPINDDALETERPGLHLVA